MKLYRFELESAAVEAGEQILVNDFESSEAIIDYLFNLHPKAKSLSVIVTLANGELDGRLWVIERTQLDLARKLR